MADLEDLLLYGYRFQNDKISEDDQISEDYQIFKDDQIEKVVRQVEFYFSDSNLPKDKFLKKAVQESEDGLVNVSLICSFKRMCNHLKIFHFKPDEMPEAIVLAVAEMLKKSSVLKLSEDGKRVGRITELSKPEVVQEQVDSRTIAASPLPYDVQMEDLEAFFGQQAKVNSVRLPRVFGDKKCFCGTALIEFSEAELAKKVLTEKLVYAGVELELRPKKDFDAEREKQLEDYRKTHIDSNNENDGYDYKKGLIVSFKLKSISKEESNEQTGQDIVCKTDEGTMNVEKESCIAVADQALDTEKVKSSEDVTIENSEKTDTITEKNGSTSEDVKIESDESAKSPKESVEEAVVDAKNIIITRENLREVFAQFGAVKYVDFKMGDESGYVRFFKADAAVKARAAAVLADEGGLVVQNCIATLEPLTGDAEKEYWKMLLGNKEKSRDNRGNNSRGRGRNNRGRQSDGKRHRQGSNAGDGRANKVQKVSA